MSERTLLDCETAISGLLVNHSNKGTREIFKALLQELKRFNIVGFNVCYFLNLCENPTNSTSKKVNDLLNRTCHKMLYINGVYYRV